MATELKRMKLTSVDLVRAGANQEADIVLFKSAGPEVYHEALAKSVRSILDDPELEEAQRSEMLAKTVEEYRAALEEPEEPEPEEPEGEEVMVEKKPEEEEPADLDEIEEVEKNYDIIEEVQKFNPFHDALGRFASSNSFRTYSANPKSKAGAMAIGRSARAGHTGTMNVHTESKGENIGQNYTWLQTGQKPAFLTGGSGTQQTPPPPPVPKPKRTRKPKAQQQTQPQQAQQTQQAQHTMAQGKDISKAFSYSRNSGDSAVEQAAKAQGFTGKPKVVPKAAFDAAAQASGFVAFRTVNDGADVKTGKRIKSSVFADTILHGDAGKFSLNGSGGQAYGGGMYMAASKSPKKGTAPTSGNIANAIMDSHCYGNQGRSTTVTGTLDPSARIGSYHTVSQKWTQLPRTERRRFDYDIGAYAAALGYDALKATNRGIGGCDYLMVYNRTKLIFLEDVSPY